MEETKKVETYLCSLVTVMIARAEKEVDAVMPGYTHLQVNYLTDLVISLIAGLPPSLSNPSFISIHSFRILINISTHLSFL